MAKAAQTTVQSTTYNTPYDVPVTSSEVIRTTLLNRVSWGAVAAGITMIFATQLILNLFGIGIGLAALDSFTGAGISSAEFSWSTVVWWAVAGVIAAFIGGFTAGRLVGEPKESTCGWHGLVAWASSILLVAVLMTTAAGTAMGTGGPIQVVMGQETVAFNAPGSESTVAVTTSDDTVTADDYATDDMAGDEMQGPYGSDMATAAEPSAGDAATTGATTIEADSIAAAALISAIALVLGALAAWFGGRAGTVEASVIRNGRYNNADSMH